MTDNTVNIPLLRKAVEWAEAEAAKPRELREWEQAFYVLPASDNDPVIGDNVRWTPSIDRERIGKAPECGTCYCIAGYVANLSGKPFTYATAESVACAELGLGRLDYAGLFLASNTIEDVRRIAEDIAGEPL